MNWYSPFLNEEIFLIRDYAQLEIRILAQFSKDKLLCQQLNSGQDIHVQVGQEILGWSAERVKKEKKARVIAKQIHFGIVYGLQPRGILARVRRAGVKAKLSEMEDAHERYFNRYKGVAEFIEYCTAYTEQHGMSIPTLYGMQRPIRVGDREAGHAFWGNVAVNTPIQGSAAHIALLALALVKRNPQRYALLRHAFRNEVHDSLVATPKICDLAEADGKFQYLMEQHVVEESKRLFGVKFLIPLVSEPSVGFRYGVNVDYDRKKPLDVMLDEWCKKNREIEVAFRNDPLHFVDAQRGAPS